MSSKLDRRFYYYLRSILDQEVKLIDFILVHEIYLSTLDLIRFLFILQKKKYKCSLRNPFTYIISCSSHFFPDSEYRKFYRKIKKKNPEDAAQFQEKWAQKELSKEAPIIKVSASTSTSFGSHTYPTGPQRRLSISLRDSVKNVVELLKAHQRSSSLSDIPKMKELSILSTYNIRTYSISAALTFIDQQLFQQICVPDLPSLGRENKYTFSLIREQQEKLKEWVMDEIRSSEDHVIQVRQCIWICKHLKKQRNYNSLFSILRGIEDSGKDIVKELPYKKQTFFQNMLSMYDPERSYRNYRMYVHDKSVAVPCFPIFARDVYLIFEHNVLWLNKTSSKSRARINEEFIQYLSYHYRMLQSSQNVDLIGKIDLDLVKALSFFTQNDRSL